MGAFQPALKHDAQSLVDEVKPFAESREFVLTINSILELGEKESKKVAKETGNVQQYVAEITKKHSKNTKLAEFLLKVDPFLYASYFHGDVFKDTQVLLAALRNNPEVYEIKHFSKPIDLKFLSSFEEHKEMADILLRYFVKTGKDLPFVQSFMKKIAGENKEALASLQNMYEHHLKMASRVQMSDVKRKALLLALSHRDIYEICIGFGILTYNGEFNKKQAQLLGQEIAQTVKNHEKPEILSFLLQKLGFAETVLQNAPVKALLDAFTTLLSTYVQAHKASVDLEVDSGENSKTDVIEGEKSGEQIDAEDSDKFDFCTQDASCTLSYSLSSGGNYVIETAYSQKIEMTKEEFSSYSAESLENFLKFHALLFEGGLLFLLNSKYRSGFFHLMRERHMGFDPYSGAGFSKIYQLDALNVIAHLIGIPKDLYGKGLSHFNDKVTAITAFQTIHDTGKILDEYVADPGSFWGNGATYVKLKQLEVLGKNGGFQVETAKSILKKNMTSSDDATQMPKAA